MHMRVNASDVDVFLFKDEETLEKQLALLEKAAQHKDRRSYTSGDISEAAQSKTARNGLYVLVIRSRNQQVTARVIYLFQSL
jgi:hypothetical protein